MNVSKISQLPKTLFVTGALTATALGGTLLLANRINAQEKADSFETEKVLVVENNKTEEKEGSLFSKIMASVISLGSLGILTAASMAAITKNEEQQEVLDAHEERMQKIRQEFDTKKEKDIYIDEDGFILYK